jgi:hypothetical protein
MQYALWVQGSVHTSPTSTSGAGLVSSVKHSADQTSDCTQIVLPASGNTNAGSVSFKWPRRQLSDVRKMAEHAPVLSRKLKAILIMSQSVTAFVYCAVFSCYCICVVLFQEAVNMPLLLWGCRASIPICDTLGSNSW